MLKKIIEFNLPKSAIGWGDNEIHIIFHPYPGYQGDSIKMTLAGWD